MAKQKINQYQRMNDDGWQIGPSGGTYNSSNSLIYSPGVISGILYTGMLLKLTNDSTVKYFRITNIMTDGSSNNIVVLEGFNNVTLANSAVTSVFCTYGQAPAGLGTAGANVIGNSFKTMSGVMSCATAVATSVVALSAPAIYIATAYYASNEANNLYFETAIISTDGTTRSKVTILQDGATIVIGMSSLNMTITQSSGITLPMQWSIMRII